MTAKAPLHVSLVAVPGTLAMPVAGLYEVLTAFPVVAGVDDTVPATPPFRVEIVGAGRQTMAAASGLPITIQRDFRELEHSDIVILPTMAVDEHWMPGRHPELVGWMRRMHERGACLCSACTGLVLLAETGLLDGHSATTHWMLSRHIREHFPAIELCLDEILVVAGEREGLVMSGGGASWQDLVLYLIARFVSPQAARAIARFELLEQHAEGQGPYLSFQPPLRHGDALVLELQQWLAAHFAIASPVAVMTRKSGLSPRAFQRRFQRVTGYAPSDYVQQLRIQEAKRRLEQSSDPVDQIAWDVGYQDPAAFRRLFKRVTRLTAGAYRRKFRMPQDQRANQGQGTEEVSQH